MSLYYWSDHQSWTQSSDVAVSFGNLFYSDRWHMTEWSHPGLRGSCGPLPCSFFTSISLLLLRASRIFPKEPLRRREPLPSWREKTESAFSEDINYLLLRLFRLQRLFSPLVLVPHWSAFTLNSFLMSNNHIIHIHLSALCARSCWPLNKELVIIELVLMTKWNVSELTPFHSAESSPSLSPRCPAGPFTPSLLCRLSPPPAPPSFSSSTTLLWLMASMPWERRQREEEKHVWGRLI